MKFENIFFYKGVFNKYYFFRKEIAFNKSIEGGGGGWPNASGSLNSFAYREIRKMLKWEGTGGKGTRRGSEKGQNLLK